MKEFRINEHLTVKLISTKTIIYINGVEFKQCKFLLLDIPINRITLINELDSIDEIVNNLETFLEDRDSRQEFISPEIEFWGHCSNLQVWYENRYDTRLLHVNLAFPLLKKLVEVGDLNAMEVFKEEIINRLLSGHLSVIIFLLKEQYLQYFNFEECKMLLEDLNSILIKKLKENVQFRHISEKLSINNLKILAKNGVLEEMLVAKILRMFNSKNEKDFKQLISEECYKNYLSKDNYEKVLSNISIDFFTFIVDLIESNHDFTIIDESCQERSGIYSAFELLENLKKVSPELLKKWVLSLVLLPEINERIINVLIYKGFLQHLNYKDVKSFTGNQNFPLYNYMVRYNKELIFIKFPKFIIEDKYWFTSIRLDCFSIDLSNRGIKNIKDIKGLEKISNLKTLDLSNNKIKKIEGLSELKDIEILDLSWNQITLIENLDKLQYLRILNLSDNRITEIKGLNKLRDLKEIDLSNNQIRDIKKIRFMKRLKKVILSGNPIKNNQLINLKDERETSIEEKNSIDLFFNRYFDDDF